MKYRIDTFGTGHQQKTFETEAEARSYAKNQQEAGKIVFLLKEMYEGANLFDVLEVIE